MHARPDIGPISAFEQALPGATTGYDRPKADVSISSPSLACLIGAFAPPTSRRRMRRGPKGTERLISKRKSAERGRPTEDWIRHMIHHRTPSDSREMQRYPHNVPVLPRSRILIENL